MAHSRPEEGENARMGDRRLSPGMVIAGSSMRMLLLHMVIGLSNFTPRTYLNPSIPLYALLVVLQKNMGYVRVHFQTGGSSFWCTEEGGIHCDLGTEEASLGGDMK